MSQNIAITAELRERAGKGTARATRRANKIPAVLYGNKQAPVLLAFNQKELETLSRKRGFFTHLFEITVEGKKHLALARDAQRHPVTENLEHVDFLRVDSKSKLTVNVPVTFINQDKSPGIKRGGVLNIVAHTLHISCEAGNIPEAIAVDLTGLEINDSVHTESLQLPAGADLVEKAGFTVVTIAAPSSVRSEMAEQATAAAAAPAAAAAAAKAPEKKK